MDRRSTLPAGIILATLTLFCGGARAQIVKTTGEDGRQLFVNAEPPRTIRLGASKLHATIYMNAESSFTGYSRPPVSIDRDGAEKLVREAADRHHVDPALIRAVGMVKRAAAEANRELGVVSAERADAIVAAAQEVLAAEVRRPLFLIAESDLNDPRFVRSRGTQPVEQCQLHGGGGMRVAGWETGQPARASDPNLPVAPGAVSLQPRLARTSQPALAPGVPESPSQPQAPPKRKGFFERLRGIFK